MREVGKIKVINGDFPSTSSKILKTPNNSHNHGTVPKKT